MEPALRITPPSLQGDVQRAGLARCFLCSDQPSQRLNFAGVQLGLQRRCALAARIVPRTGRVAVSSPAPAAPELELLQRNSTPVDLEMVARVRDVLRILLIALEERRALNREVVRYRALCT